MGVVLGLNEVWIMEKRSRTLLHGLIVGITIYYGETFLITTLNDLIILKRSG